jgi:hypothetical protein
MRATLRRASVPSPPRAASTAAMRLGALHMVRVPGLRPLMVSREEKPSQGPCPCMHHASHTAAADVLPSHMQAPLHVATTPTISTSQRMPWQPLDTTGLPSSSNGKQAVGANGTAALVPANQPAQQLGPPLPNSARKSMLRAARATFK